MIQQFKECDECAAKPGAPTLCAHCLERRDETAFLNSLENSVGYVESVNKNEFFKGARVAYSWLTAAHQKTIREKDSRAASLESERLYYKTDLKKICEIIHRHSED